MDTNNTMKYMVELETALAANSNIYIKPRSQRSIEVHYRKPELDSYGAIVISRRNLSEHYSLKLTLYSYDNIKKCSKTLKDISLDDAVSEIMDMVNDTAEIITRASEGIDQFKSIITSEFGKRGYIAACESKFMIMLTAKNSKITVAFSEDGTFKASYSKTHSKTATSMYETQGRITQDSAHLLVNAFSSL